MLSTQNHLHVLIFGAVSPKEAESHAQRRQLSIKVANGSGEEEWDLGCALAASLARATGLPAAVMGVILRCSAILSSPMSGRAICTF